MLFAGITGCSSFFDELTTAGGFELDEITELSGGFDTVDELLSGFDMTDETAELDDTGTETAELLSAGILSDEDETEAVSGSLGFSEELVSIDELDDVSDETVGLCVLLSAAEEPSSTLEVSLCATLDGLY